MYQGAYVKKRRKSRVRMNRATVLLMAILVLIGVVAGSTVAYLIDKTDRVANTFEYAKVSCEITENFDKTTKSNVQVKNTGTTDAYIRATYVVNWPGGIQLCAYGKPGRQVDEGHGRIFLLSAARRPRGIDRGKSADL